MIKAEMSMKTQIKSDILHLTLPFPPINNTSWSNNWPHWKKKYIYIYLDSLAVMQPYTFRSVTVMTWLCSSDVYWASWWTVAESKSVYKSLLRVTLAPPQWLRDSTSKLLNKSLSHRTCKLQTSSITLLKCKIDEVPINNSSSSE